MVDDSNSMVTDGTAGYKRHSKNQDTNDAFFCFDPYTRASGSLLIVSSSFRAVSSAILLVYSFTTSIC